MTTKGPRRRTSKRPFRIVPRSVLFAGVASAAVVPVLVGGCSKQELGVAADCASDPRCLGVANPGPCQKNPTLPQCRAASPDSGDDADADAPSEGGNGGDGGDGGDAADDASDADAD